jgi:uncharacterized membrane protein
MDVLSMLMMLLPLVWPLLLGALLLQAFPDLMRPSLSFGVTVDPLFRGSELGRDIRRRYSIGVWTGTLVAIALAVTAAFAATGTGWAPTALAALVTHARLRYLPCVLQYIGALLAFVRAYRETRPHAAQRASVVKVELSTRSPAPSVILAVLAVPIASLAVLAAWTGIHWHDVPSRLAVHWAFAGPDRWVTTTPANVATLLSVHAIVCLPFAAITLGVLHGSRRIATAREAVLRERQFRARNVSLLIAVEYFSVFPAWAGLLGLPSTAMTLWQLVCPATILVLVARLLLAGQGGTRGLARGNSTVGDRTDDRYWTWGILYFNRGDPAFLVESRFGVGYTFNFAHPFAWPLLTLLAAIPFITRLL